MSDSSPATPDSGRATPPFADGPSNFLENLTSKIQSGSVSANAVAELHRVRAELSGQVQATSNRHEMHLKQMSARIAALQQEFKPKIQNVERQLGFTQKQLDELRQRVQKLATEEVSGLQHQFDQMGARFDRFMRTDVDSKLKPMHDAIRHARTRLDELENTANSGFKKMNDNTTALATRMRETRTNAEEQEESLDEQLDDLVPRIEALERALGEVGDTSVVGKAPVKRTVSTPAQMGLRLKAAQDNFSEFKGDVMPAMIQESAATFVDAAQQVGQFCDFKIGELQTAMDTVDCENRMVEQQRRQEEETLDKLMKAGLEVQNRLEVLGQDTIAKVTALEQSLESTANGLLAQISDVSVGTTNEGDEAQRHVEDEVSELKVSIDGLIAKLRRLVKKCGQENLDAQKQVLTRISGIRNQLVGKENALGRTEATEERMDWVIDEIQRIDAERIRAQEKNGSPQSLANRLANIDERLAECNERLDALESTYPKNNQRKKVTERKIVQPEENPYEVSHRGFDHARHEEEEEEKLQPNMFGEQNEEPVDLSVSMAPFNRNKDIEEEQKLEPIEPVFAPEEEETESFAVPRKGRKGTKKEKKLEPVEIQEPAPVVEPPRRKRKSPKEEPKLPPVEPEFAKEEEETHQDTFDSRFKDDEDVTYPVDDPVPPATIALSDAPLGKHEEEWPEAEANVEAEAEVTVPEEAPRKKRKSTKEEIKPVHPEETAVPEPEPVVEAPPRRKRKATKEEIKPPQVEENIVPEPVADAPARKRTRSSKKQEEPPVQDIPAEQPVEEAPRKKRRNVKEEPVEATIAIEEQAEAQPPKPSRKPKAKKEEPKPLPVEESPAPEQEDVKAASEAPPRRKKGTKKEEPKPLPIEESPIPEHEDLKAASEAPPRRKKSTKKEEEAEPNVLPASEEPATAASDAPRKRRHKRQEAPPPASTDTDGPKAAPPSEEKPVNPASDSKNNRKDVTPEEEQIQLPTQNLMDRLVQTSPPAKKSRSHEDENKMIPMKSLHESLLGMQGEEPEKSEQRHRRHHRSHKKKNE